MKSQKQFLLKVMKIKMRPPTGENCEDKGGASKPELDGIQHLRRQGDEEEPRKKTEEIDGLGENQESVET